MNRFPMTCLAQIFVSPQYCYTAYVGYVTSTQTAGKLYLTFPYKVLIQSITVKNRSYATSGDIVGGIRTGTIKCSTAGNGTYDITYATINRGSDAETRSAATTYTNANYQDCCRRRKNHPDLHCFEHHNRHKIHIGCQHSFLHCC